MSEKKGIPLSDLDPKQVSPEMGRILFGNDWDPAIDFYRAVAEQAGMTADEWQKILDETGDMMRELVPIPKGLDTESAKPYVALSDMLILATVARFCFQRVDDLPDAPV